MAAYSGAVRSRKRALLLVSRRDERVTPVRPLESGQRPRANRSRPGRHQRQHDCRRRRNPRVQNNITVAEPITLTGTLRNAAGRTLLSGAISLTATTRPCYGDKPIIDAQQRAERHGRFGETGPGLLTLAGTTRTPTRGATLVNEGTLLLNKPMTSRLYPAYNHRR